MNALVNQFFAVITHTKAASVVDFRGLRDLESLVERWQAAGEGETEFQQAVRA